MEKNYEDGIRDGMLKALEQRVEDMERLGESFGAQLASSVKELGEELRCEFRARIDPISKAFLGNGDTDKSIISRLSSTTHTANTNRWILGIMLVALVGLAIRVIVALGI